MLTRVTLTGADDNVDPRDLAILSKEFPFVEWGILFSPKRTGTARYPTEEWVAKLRVVADQQKMALAAHFCGACTRDTLAGNTAHLADKHIFQRVQLNGFTFPAPSLIELAQRRDTEFILQVRQMDAMDDAIRTAMAMNLDARDGLAHASILFDPSGGTGVAPTEWPSAPTAAVRMGYAGGIGPDNVLDVMSFINVRRMLSTNGDPTSPYWIDMESGVRTDDTFDLQKCRKVLEQCAEWMSTPEDTLFAAASLLFLVTRSVKP